MSYAIRTKLMPETRQRVSAVHSIAARKRLEGMLLALKIADNHYAADDATSTWSNAADMIADDIFDASVLHDGKCQIDVRGGAQANRMIKSPSGCATARCQHWDVGVIDGVARLYKCVNEDFGTQNGVMRCSEVGIARNR